ncbi:pleckstrin homology domain-containing family G member 4B isoform X1 [Pygocentrus nattereri]|uniref:DH domain-containing protein n=1 Tax=Pygocentrus nattereri TaxID=42514 RepID=A0A3B4D9Q7_PYGNA|nr:pleckstrin homology domain-containing family G member 4B isoform X1 [Pygocentrus nattereri]
MNPDSLDSSIQSCLSALYTPFEVTAPTVLSQLFQVIEGLFHGDPLRCLTDFLIPARRLLERVQQTACAPYSDVVFRYAGWPLCLQERVVIHLAPINPLLLSPGDFYLQVAPFGEQEACIVVQSLLEEERRELEETPFLETSYPSIFTQDWLKELNAGRHGKPLSRCLLATEQGIVKVPWDQVANPEFVDKPQHMACSGSSNQQESMIGPQRQGTPAPSAYSVETRICPAKHGIAVSLCLIDSSRKSEMDQARPEMRPVGWVSPNTWDSRSKNSFGRDHIDLVDVPKRKDSTGYSKTRDQPRTLLRSKRVTPPTPSGPTLQDCPTSHDHPTPQERPTCGRTVRFAEQPRSPCIRRKHGQGAKTQECRYRESYKEAQQSPVSIEKRLQEQVFSEECVRIESKTLHRKEKHSNQYPQSQTVRDNTTADDRTAHENSQDILVDLADICGGTITCFTPTVVGTSEKCHVVIQGQPSEGCRDSPLEMIPRLHVVHGKKTTTFGLVSPKLNRRRLPKQDDPQDPKTVSPLANVPRTNTLLSSSQTDVEEPKAQAPLPSKSKPEASLLQSGITCLTGGRDRLGRAVVEVYGDDQYWKSSLVSSLELAQLILYFHTITRKEVRELGMTIVYDARNTPPHSKFTEALRLVHEEDPQAVCSVLLLMSKEKSHSQEKYPGGMELVLSLRALHKFVEPSQLTSALGGSFPYSHRHWLDLHRELHPFVLDLKEATSLLLGAIRKLEGVHKIDSVQDVQQCINKQRALMKDVLEDTRLVSLQREGGAMLARLRWESDVKAAYCEESRLVMDNVEDLYNQVEEQVHVLARRSNMSLQHLNFLLQLREMESRFTKIREWFDVGREKRLLESVEESSGRLQETLQSFTTFLFEANEQRLQAMMLVTEAESIQGPNYPETEVFHTMVSAFKSSLSDFLPQVEQCCDELESMVNLCHFCKRATEVAEECSQQLEQERLQCMTQQEKQTILQRCHEKMSEFSPDCFQEAKAQACSLQISRAMQVWNVAWVKCQEVSRQLEQCLQDLEQDQHPSAPHGWNSDGIETTNAEVSFDETSVPLPQAGMCRDPLDQSEVKLCRDRDSIYGTVSCFNINFRQSRKGRKGSRAALAADQDPTNYIKNSPRKTSHDRRQNTIEGSGTVGCQWFPWQHNSRRYIGEDSASAQSSPKSQTLSSTGGEPQVPAHASESQMPDPTLPGTQTTVPTWPQIQPPCRSLQATQDYQHSHPGSFYPEESYIEAGLQDAFHSEEVVIWDNDGALTGAGTASNTIKLQRIMEELLLTELDYVRSLGYILTHYVPLLARLDVPPDLRGQRGTIFGNLEKLYDFHCQYFLQELEACRTEPLRVGRCFLRHRESFGLYALYSKNKPQSDALIQQHTFFKRKQLELRDSMDLSSYLLKPVQRISKYSLLLQEMLGECGPQQVSERQEIQAAAEVIRFQLRHGNDLLTMDAIRDCDVNLMEQGQLIRQDEFCVMFRKKKALRRVFLFQDLILFTKAKKTHRGDDVYVYKQSFKTCDIGLTHSCGDSGLCFEIWFRRRRAQDTYILQAERQDIKQAWTADLEQILWEQALKNRELRRQERVFMGVGSKAYVDIQSSEGAIHNRAVTCSVPGREMEGLLKTPNVVSSLQKDVALPRPESISSGSNASTSGSQSSSSSGRGSLSPSSFHGNQVHGSNHRLYSTSETLSVDDHQSQCHLTDSPESSGECVCVSSCSEPYCTSLNPAIAQEAPPVAHLQQRSPTLSRKKPSVLTNPQPTTHNSLQVNKQLTQ